MNTPTQIKKITQKNQTKNITATEKHGKAKPYFLSSAVIILPPKKRDDEHLNLTSRTKIGILTPDFNIKTKPTHHYRANLNPQALQSVSACEESFYFNQPNVLDGVCTLPLL